jgi:hypothetical protein
MKKYILSLTGVLVATLIISGTLLRQSSHDKKSDHVLLFKWKPGVDSSQIAKISNLWLDMTVQVPGFDHFELNRLESQEYDHAAMLIFASNDAHEAYLNHKNHQCIREEGSRMVDKFMEFNYWK